MFGHSPPSEPKDGEDRGTVTSLSTNDKDGGNDNAGNGPNGASADGSSSGGEKRHSLGDASTGRRSTDDAVVSGEKKRRSGKASSLLASARSSLHLSGSSASAHLGAPSTAEPEDDQQNPIQQLGKQDPALAVPQGPHNNSAGESLPGARSTFSVGVTEDRNKKCRRTMEDTHSYLYNFLNTPAPHLHGQPAAAAAAAACDPDADASDTADPASKVVETDNGYFAIFDGHAGTFAADWCGKKLHSILEDAIRKHPNTPIPELLDQTFVTVDHELEKLPLKNSGCTAVIAVLRWEDRIPGGQSATGSSALGPAAAAAAAAAAATSQSGGGGVDAASQPGQGQPTNARSNEGSHASPSASNATSRLQQGASRQRVLYTANVGDARIVLCRNGKALRLSYDHKGSDENEGKRVANAGGLILNNRVNGVLAVTRALGDAYMKDLVTGHPYTTETVIKPDMDEFIVLACDGLWDVCEDQEAVDLVRNVQDPQAASKVLVDHALSRFSTDNLSCMIVRLDSSALRNRVERRADPIGVEGDPGMAKPGGISEADAKVLEAKEKVLREEGKEPHSQQPNGKEKASSQAPTHDQPGREEAGTTKGGEGAVEGSSSSGNEARNGGAPGTGGGNAATTLSFVSNPTTEPRQDQEAGSGAGNEGSSTSTS